MSVYKRPGQTEYSYDFRYRQKRFSGSTGCTTKREAEKFEESERKRVAANKIDMTKPLTFVDATVRYWEEVGKFVRNSVDAERYLDWLSEEIGDKTLLSTISEANIATLVAKRRGTNTVRGKPPANATVNRSVCEPMRALLLRAKKVWKVPVQDIDWSKHFLGEAQERIREASVNEETTLMSTIRGDYAPALRFALLTGCRRAEIVGLKWNSVNFFAREFIVLGKGDKRRTIPMTKAVFDLLWELKDNHKEAVFTYKAQRVRDGRNRDARYPITMEGFKTEWRRTKARAEKAGTPLEDFRFHDNRHTAATRLVRATGNLRLAQKMLGHTDIKTTTRYAHVTHDDLRAGMEAASPTTITTEDKTVEGKELNSNGKLG